MNEVLNYGSLGRLASESGRLRYGDGGHGRGDRRRRPFMLPILINNQLEGEDHATRYRIQC